MIHKESWHVEAVTNPLAEIRAQLVRENGTNPDTVLRYYMLLKRSGLKIDDPAYGVGGDFPLRQYESLFEYLLEEVKRSLENTELVQDFWRFVEAYPGNYFTNVLLDAPFTELPLQVILAYPKLKELEVVDEADIHAWDPESVDQLDIGVEERDLLSILQLMEKHLFVEGREPFWETGGTDVVIYSRVPYYDSSTGIEWPLTVLCLDHIGTPENVDAFLARAREYLSLKGIKVSF